MRFSDTYTAHLKVEIFCERALLTPVLRYTYEKGMLTAYTIMQLTFCLLIVVDCFILQSKDL